MKIAQLVVPLAVAAFVNIASSLAAPVESVESARASAARQQVDAFLSEQVVVDQFTQLGVTQADIQTRLAKLSDSQIEELAAQINLLQSGGTIQGGNPHPLGPLGCIFRQFHETICHILRFLFCWNDIR